MKVKLNNSKILIVKVIIVFMCIMCISGDSFSASYIYNLNKEIQQKSVESSISTVSSNVTPEFSFESVSQILIEPYTGKVLYENNADEKLLPASVTKVMTY